MLSSVGTRTVREVEINLDPGRAGPTSQQLLTELLFSARLGVNSIDYIQLYKLWLAWVYVYAITEQNLPSLPSRYDRAEFGYSSNYPK